VGLGVYRKHMFESALARSLPFAAQRAGAALAEGVLGGWF